MKFKIIICAISIAAGSLLVCNAVHSEPETLPRNAINMVDKYERFRLELQQEMEKKLAVKREGLIKELKKIQDTRACQGDLDAAVAVRDKIRSLKLEETLKQELPGVTIRDFDGPLGRLQATPGAVMYFRVAGKTQDGPVWGTDMYTADSALSLAAVHAGVLKAGEKGIVKVTFKPGQQKYTGSGRNGVNSSSWGRFHLSYSVEGVDE
ncbi:MAG: hypothetical protein GY754_44335 [bacterium]|nr:hypothetical protein [bacterium]